MLSLFYLRFREDSVKDISSDDVPWCDDDGSKPWGELFGGGGGKGTQYFRKSQQPLKISQTLSLKGTVDTSPLALSFLLRFIIVVFVFYNSILFI